MSASARRPAVARKLLFAAVAWALALLALEALLALAEPLWAGAAEEEAVPLTRKEAEHAEEVFLGAGEQRRMGETLRFHVRSNVLTQHDPELLFRVKPNPTGEPVHDYTGINAQGFRGRLLEAAPPGTRTIALLGDSCAFGWGLHAYEHTIGGRLEQIYSEPSEELAPRAIFNLSQPGYSSEQTRMLFERWNATLEPDLVVAYLGWNDLYLSGSEDRDTFERLRIANTPVLRLARSTHLFRAIELAIGSLRRSLAGSPSGATRGAKGGVRRVAREHSIENLRSIASSMRNRDAYLVIVPPPSIAFMQQGGMPAYIADLRGALSGVALFLELPEMQPTAPGHESYFLRDGFHPNARGALYIAGQVARADIALELAARSRSGDAASP